MNNEKKNIPNLILDKSFNEIFEDARNKIPLYSKTWTDHNFSDPGITLLDLFSWIAETQIYSLNHIPDRVILQFLDLLGYQPRPPIPAKTVLQFDHSGNVLSLPKGTILKSTSKNNLIFETSEDYAILPLTVQKIAFSTLAGFMIRVNENSLSAFDSPNLSPFGEDRKNPTVFHVGFSANEISSIKNKYLKILIKIRDDYSDVFPLGRHGDEKPFPFFNHLRWEWARKTNNERNPIDWIPLCVMDNTEGLQKTDTVEFAIPFDSSDRFDFIKGQLQPDDSGLFWIRCNLETHNDCLPKIDGLYTNAVTAVQGCTIIEEHPSESISDNGLPNSKIQLNNSPVLGVDSIDFFKIPENTESPMSIHDKDWNEVFDLSLSGPDDHDFVLNRNDGLIAFGDSLHGIIPPDGSSAKIQYRFGDVGDFDISTDSVFEIFDNTKSYSEKGIIKHIVNQGTKTESLNDVIERIKEDLQIPFRAVTAEDFEYIAKSTPGLRVGRAAVKFKENDNSVDVVAIPFCPDNPCPLPNQEFLDAICNHVDSHRLLTTAINVIAPNYVEISIFAKIRSKTNVSANEIKNTLDDFLSPASLEGNCRGWPMNRSVYKSEVISIIEQVAGVDCVDSLIISANGKKGTFEKNRGNVDFPTNYSTFVCPGKHIVEITYSEDTCKIKCESKEACDC